MKVQIFAKWTPRDPSGRFREYLSTGSDTWYEVMMWGHEQVAQLAADAAPHGPMGTHYLGEEMFLGGGGRSMVSDRVFTVEPGDPYGPQAGTAGVHSTPDDPIAVHGGKYYSLMDWVIAMGMEKDAAYAIAKSMNYTGPDYMGEAFAASREVVVNMGQKLINYVIMSLD